MLLSLGPSAYFHMLYLFFNLFLVVECKNQKEIQIFLQGVWVHIFGPNSTKSS